MFFFFNDTATTEIYTLSLHDALPIFDAFARDLDLPRGVRRQFPGGFVFEDRKSTRLNSSHTVISYAVFCLKKKKNTASHNQRAESRQRLLRTLLFSHAFSLGTSAARR